MKKTPLKRIPLKRKTKHNIEELVGFSTQLWELFLSIWNKRVHKCESCEVSLGNEPKTYMFDHLLEKSKYPELKFEEQNIFLCCFECHECKTNGFPKPKHKEAIDNIKQIYGI